MEGLKDSLDWKKILSFRRAVILAASIIIIRLALLAAIKDREMFLPIDDVIFAIGSGITAIAMLYGASNSIGRARKAWIVLAISQIVYFLGEASWAVIEGGLHQNPFPSAADFFYLAYYPIFALGIILLPEAPLTRREQIKALIDAGIVIIASSLVFWAFIVAPIVSSSEETDLSLAVSVAYPIMDLVMFAALMEMIFRKLSYPLNKSLILLASGLVVVLVVDIIFLIETQQGTYVSSSLEDTFWLISDMLFLLAGIMQANSKSLSQPVALNVAYNRSASWTQYLPYLGIGGTALLFVLNYGNAHFINSSIMAGFAIAMVGLLSVRHKMVLDESNQLLVITQSQVEELNLAKKALQESKDYLDTIINSIGDPLLVKDRQHRVTLVNDAACKIFGRPREEILGKTSYDLFPSREMADISWSKEEEAFKNGVEIKNEETNTYAPGVTLTVLVKKTPYTDNAGNQFLVGLTRDITERKQAEDKIIASLQEKEILLKEIHHRVKNNLQIISSLLSLQSSELTDDNIIRIFSDSQNRIKSMALVHENLYRSDDLGKVDFNDYLNQLVSYLSQSYGDLSRKIDFKVNSDNVLLNVNTAIPCGMIINELISNSLKYAFPDGRSGKISIDLSSEDDGFRLVVSDNGVGFKGNLNVKESKTLGYLLIETLVKQIHGRMSLDTTNGTRCEIHFKGLI